mmetsp:Transcript_24975/g.62836  ORF Transcript_24975/g.62836 Transcript_24975/m.62836 type:complete len:286 (-) Transcript_24975:588-1445(-)
MPGTTNLLFLFFFFFFFFQSAVSIFAAPSPPDSVFLSLPPPVLPDAPAPLLLPLAPAELAPPLASAGFAGPSVFLSSSAGSPVLPSPAGADLCTFLLLPSSPSSSAPRGVMSTNLFLSSFTDSLSWSTRSKSSWQAFTFFPISSTLFSNLSMRFLSFSTLATRSSSFRKDSSSSLFFCSNWRFSNSNWPSFRWAAPAPSPVLRGTSPPAHASRNLPFSLTASRPLMKLPRSGMSLPLFVVAWKKMTFLLSFSSSCPASSPTVVELLLVLVVCGGGRASPKPFNVQ